MEKIGDTVTGIINGFIGFIKGIFDAFKTFFQQIWDAVVYSVTIAWGTELKITKLLQVSITAIKPIFASTPIFNAIN